MPHHPEDQARYAHQLIRQEEITARRRSNGRPPKIESTGNRIVVASQLVEAVGRVLQEQQQRVLPPRGINPHLVFRVPLRQSTHIDTIIDLFRRAGITVVSVETDRAVIAFRDDNNLNRFQEFIESYRRGPRLGINPQSGQPYQGTSYDILEFIDAQSMRLWHREDRIGERLGQEIGRSGEQIILNSLYTIEFELWYPENREHARRQMAQIRNFLQERVREGERFLDMYIGEHLAIAKVIVFGSTLNLLLGFDIIAEIDLPPSVQFQPLLANQSTSRDFPIPPRPPENGPRLCIIDSGIVSNHPLLAPYVGHEMAFLTSDESPADTNGHGTMVGGIAVYGDMRACYEARSFSSDITLYSARILNEQCMFDDEKLIITQLRAAIAFFTAEPYRCRIFNISIGSFSAEDLHSRRQNRHAEALDILAREFKVLIIVSAGNNQNMSVSNVVEAEEALISYPVSLLSNDSKLNDFAMAAIPITVGALAQYDGIALRRGDNNNDIVRLIANADQPSPITRTGAGIQGAIKPEFVHYGGSHIFDRSSPRPIHHDIGTAIMSLSHRPLERLFAYNVGTSFAAPRVARLAAKLENKLVHEFNIDPHPNLIRALLATSARIPEPSRNVLDTTGDRHAAVKVCGYGLPDEDLSLYSADRRVTLFAQSDIQVDNFHIYSIPIPESFRYAQGTRTITLALAFDPPVAGRRLDYLGVEMSMFLVRGKTSEEVFDCFRRLDNDENIEQSIPPRYNVTLQPSGNPHGNHYNRLKSTLQCAYFTLKRPDRADSDYGDEYWFVVRSQRRWAPSEIRNQSYAIAVTLEANSPDLYAQVQQRIQQRIQQRNRIRS